LFVNLIWRNLLYIPVERETLFRLSLSANISQETLTEMIGTTRSRVSFFMNRFRKLGFIDYHARDELQVHSSLLNIVLHD
jgi:CRP/FNR family cyclic AMP-dependent transcriptional regulator